MHDPPDNCACFRSIQQVTFEVPRARPRLIEQMRLSDQPRVEHLDFDGGSLHGFGGYDSKTAAVVIELDRNGRRQQVSQHGRVVRWRPRQTADPDNQLELLRMAQSIHVHRKELAVQLPDRAVATLLVRPTPPVAEPHAERLANVGSIVLVLDMA